MVEFIDTLKVGDVIHYDTRFRSYIRLQAVLVCGRKKLKSIALVGNWLAHDLPHWSKTGELVMGEARLIGSVFLNPIYESMIWEAPGYAYRQASNDEVNPLSLQPIDLAVPPMTEKQKTDAVFYRAIERVRGILDTATDGFEQANEPGQDPQVVLQRAMATIKYTLNIKASK